jgi:transcriptional regulator with XRE-family HTH domain
MRREPAGRQNGAAIRALRVKDRRSANDMAQQVGLHPQALRNIENNTKPAGTETIRRIADLLNVPVEAITRNGAGICDEPAEAEPEGAAAA